jgi:hypothetical protein
MKWQRGLFRLWLVLSVCWVMVIGAFTWSILPPDEEVPGWARDESKDLPDAPWIKNPPPTEPAKPQFDPDRPFVIVRSAERAVIEILSFDGKGDPARSRRVRLITH